MSIHQDDIVGVGGRLDPETLLRAYRRGIFPWPVEGLPLLVLFYVTPVFYPLDAVPAQSQWVFDLNPFTHLAISYQEILFFRGPIGHWRWLLALGAASVALFFAGYWLFDRLRDSFAEAV